MSEKLGLNATSFQIKGFKCDPYTLILTDETDIDLWTNDGINFRLVTNNKDDFITEEKVKLIAAKYLLNKI